MINYDELECTCWDVNAGECEFCKWMEWEVKATNDLPDYTCESDNDSDVSYQDQSEDDDLPF